jgi:hypothetical protein
MDIEITINDMIPPRKVYFFFFPFKILNLKEELNRSKFFILIIII